MANDWVSCQTRKHKEEPAKYAKKREIKRTRIFRFMEGMSPNPLVLEIGAGAGDDVPLLESLGCRVMPSDGAQSFVDIMTKKGIKNVFKLDVSQKKIPGTYDAIYASHVFIHMTDEDMVRILPKVYGALRPHGRFIFNVGNRDAEGGRSSGWMDLPGFHELGSIRYFHYWKNYFLFQRVEEAGFYIKKYEVDGGEDGRRWIWLCAVKP
jgi:SAM-dependent methyltransferase